MTTPSELIPSLQQALGPHYLIEREIGRGGMGVVYLARDLTLDRLVAVKVVHPDLTANRAVASRFLSEARAIAKLRHPNIVAVHAAGEVEGQFYFVMDYLDGETLRQRLQRTGRLAPGAAIRIASDIADALDAAALAGIVHRDLKPENILLEGPPDEPRALLADFGIARLAESTGVHTGPGSVMGTPAYMSPEQAAGEEIDGRSDLYSLGIVTYEMLVGTPPFSGPHRTVISKHILDRPTPIGERRAEVAPAVSAAIMRVLEKVPEARWPTGQSFRRALAGEGSSTPAAVVPRRRRRWPIFIASAAVVLAAAGVTMLRRDGPPKGTDPRHSILVLPFDNLREDPSYDWLRDGSVNMLTLTLSQWRDLTVVDQDRVHDLVSTGGAPKVPIGLQQARRLARASHVWTVVHGDFSRLGDSLRLVARRYDVATGQRLDIVQVDGLASDDVRPLFDQLAARLLDLTGAPAANWATIASVTTKSVEAYRSYLRGVQALNQWRLGDASRALEAAAALDPDFSLANYKLAITRGWISPADTLGMGAIRRAARTSERLPPRDRQLIAGYRAFVDGDYDTGLSLYAQLIGRDSTDVEAWYGWADAAFHGGYARMQPLLLSRSLKGFREVIRLDSTFALAYEHAGALLGDAGQKNGWLRLVGTDSLVAIGPGGPDSTVIGGARRQAQRQAVALAQAWTRIQPNTPRAHYHLYKAFLGSGRVNEARQTVAQLRTLFPDSTQPFFGFLDARAQFVGGDIAGSARTVRSVLPRVKPETFREIEFAPEPIYEVMTGVDALGYFGDVDGATEVIRLARAMYGLRVEERDSVEKARSDEIWELSRLGLLFGATGSRPDRLRSVWNRGVSLMKSGTDKDRKGSPEVIGSAAIGLLLGPSADPSGVEEIDRLTERQSPASVRALIAARAGDSSAARQLLSRASESKTDTAATEWHYGGDQRPIMAEAYFELGQFDQVVAVLSEFGPEAFMTRGFDSRWVLLPRVRLLRGQALEQLGRAEEAAVEFRAVVAQWGGADLELRPVVQEAQRGLARLTGVGERG